MRSTIETNPIQTLYMDLWALLAEFVDRGLTAQGDIGELIGRLLSISAMDNAEDKCELVFQAPVKVWTTTRHYSRTMRGRSFGNLCLLTARGSATICFSNLSAVAPETMSSNLDKIGESINVENHSAETLEIFGRREKTPLYCLKSCHVMFELSSRVITQ